MDEHVHVLHWPDQASEAVRLARLGVPRLLVVEPGGAPPTGTSCLEDWLRLPADDVDLRARVAALAERASRHPTAPFIDNYGQLSRRGTMVFLPPIERRLAKVLIERLGQTVLAGELISRAWAEGGSNSALRVHMSRLRRRIAPLGLTITNHRGAGYRLRECETGGAVVRTFV